MSSKLFISPFSAFTMAELIPKDSGERHKQFIKKSFLLASLKTLFPTVPLAPINKIFTFPYISYKTI